MADLSKDGSLYQALRAYGGADITPLHMPGHKRRVRFAPNLPWSLDITELEGFDNLHAPEGLLLDAQARAARLWGSDEAFFLVNGATGGLLAAIYACTQAGDRILMARGCHKSVYHAVELLRLSPVYLEPPLAAGTDITGSIPPEMVERALEAYPDIRLVVVTSPTYEGVLSDIGGIAQVVHQKNIPLLADEAHGAHLGLSSDFPSGAIHMGADIVVQSLHKTLPSLTQTAILHLRSDRISKDRLRHGLGIFQSSSPSYPLLAAMDGCVGEMEALGEAHLAAWRRRLDTFYQEADFRNLSLLAKDCDPRRIYAHDPSKITILTGGTDLSGTALMTALRGDYHIELEMALDRHALALTGLNSTDTDLERLLDALHEIDRWVSPASSQSPLPLPSMPEQVMPVGEALRGSKKQMPFSEAVGQVAGGYLWVYPPGIPLVVPGARVTAEIADYLAKRTANGMEIKSTVPTEAGLMEVIDKGPCFRYNIRDTVK